MTLKHWLKILIFAVAAVLITVLLAGFLKVSNEKDAVGIYGFFKEPEDSIDVAIIGPSSTYTSFYSPLAYEEYGFTSYTLGCSTMLASVYKTAVKEMESRQKPQLYLIETFGFCYDIQDDETALRKFLDELPDSEIKREAIEEVVPEDLKSSFLNPFEKYHAGWTNLDGCFKVLSDKMYMNSVGYSITKNFATTPYYIQDQEKESTYHISEKGFEYLEQLLAYLKEEGIENVAFIRTPEITQYEETESYYEMIDMIEEAGYDFWDINAAAEEIGLDRNHDFYNTSHVNVFGAEKCTRYMGQYIMDHYNIDTNHSDEITKEWDYCSSFNDQVLSRLESLTEEKVNGYLYTQRDLLGD